MTATIRWPGIQARVDVPERVVERLRATACMLPEWAWAALGEDDQVAPIALSAGAVSRTSEALPLVHRLLNGAAVNALAPRFIVLHAGAVALGNRAILLPAASGSGKSTLVAGLVAAGCEYLSDEVAVLDPRTLCLLPFGNCISLKAGGRRVLSQLRCSRRERIDGQAVWRVPIAPARQPVAPVVVRCVVLPRYVASAPAVLGPVVRSRALEACLAQAYRLDLHGPLGLAAVVKMVQSSACFSLVGGDLRECVELVLSALRGGSAAPAHTGTEGVLAAV